MWARQTKDGRVRFCERYTDSLTGKKKDVCVTFDKDNARTRKEAMMLLQQKITNKSEPKNNRYTLGRMSDEFLHDQKLSVAESTYKNMTSQINSIVSILGRDVYVDKITPRFYRNSCLESGKKPKTLNNYLDKFITMWLWAYKNSIVNSTDLIDKIDTFKDDEPEKDIEEMFLESDEVKLVLNAVKKQEHMLVFKMLFLSGMRVGEAMALTISDIDFDNKKIYINKNYSPVTRKVDKTKTKASNDSIYMQPELEDVIKQLMAYTKTKQIRLGFRTKLLFCNNKGTHYNYTTLWRSYKKAVYDATGKDMSIHSTRHTHCSLLFEQGFTVDQCQRRLRHEDSKITKKIYIHVTKRLKEKDAEQLKAVCLL